jgi:hypothetical protein
VRRTILAPGTPEDASDPTAHFSSASAASNVKGASYYGVIVRGAHEGDTRRCAVFRLTGTESRAARRLPARPTKATQLCRPLVVALPNPFAATPRVLGLDEFALCKEHNSCGTVLVDCETRAPVDLLPEREAVAFAAWLTPSTRHGAHLP